MFINKFTAYFKEHGIKKTLRRSFLEFKNIHANYINKKCFSQFVFGDDIYRLWVERNEPNYETLVKQVKLSKEFKERPLISIITPVFNPPTEAFVEMMESITRQTYDNWELCLADASSSPYVREIIESYVSGNQTKIKVKYLKTNKGISGNSNEALSMATGDYVALLDHDDALARFALFEVVKALNEDPEIDFIYSDRDIITTEGKRLHPFFKPDWSPDYLLSQNYICHLNVFRKSLSDSLGGFREGYDGSQDYDLALRVTEATDKIFHIPMILYHWRIVEGSSAVDPEAKPYAYDAAIKALTDAFERRRWKGKVIEGASKGYYNPVFHINKHEKVSIVIASEFKEGGRALKKCLDSIRNMTSYDSYEIIIVKSGASDADELAMFQHMDNIKILRYDGHFNFHEMSNYAVSASGAEHIVFLGEDTEIVTHEWLESMLGLSQRKETGIVGAKLLYLDGYVQSAGLIINKNGKAILSHHRHPQDSSGYNGRIAYINNVSAVSDVCMMVKKEIFEAVSGFDPDFSVYSDIDLCFKIRQKDLLVVYEPRVEVLYNGSLYLEKENINRETTEAHNLFMKKWGGIIAKGDPYYNPNLDSENCDFSIKI
jgi:glycosyltransferase involved in cell wall biosynthesis